MSGAFIIIIAAFLQFMATIMKVAVKYGWIAGVA